MNKIVMISTLFIFMIAGSATAQMGYERGLGVRVGSSTQGITYKQSIGDRHAFEGIAGLYSRGFHFVGLYQIYQSAFDVPNLSWFYGAGGHFAAFDGRNHPWWDNEGSSIAIGVDGILGLEYNIEEIPFAVSLDYKPAFTIFQETGFTFTSAALSIRYTFD